MKSHIIFGAGLVGGYIGGILTSLGLSVKLVCRPTVQKKLSQGVLLTDYSGNTTEVKKLEFIAPNKVNNTNDNIHLVDFIWITVKCTGIEQASTDITSLFGPKTTILCCQNGLGSHHIIKNCFPNNQVLRVMVPFNIAEPKSGHLHRGSEGFLTIEKSKQVESLVKFINTPLLPVKDCQDMQSLLWAKLQLNLGNSINALANIPVKQMLQQRAYRLVIAQLMDELLLVTKGLNIQLPRLTALPAKYVPKILRLPNFLFTMVANKMLAIDPTVRTSMWWDLSQGKKTEIDYINGAVVKAANQLGITATANKNVIELIKRQEKNNETKKTFEGIKASALLKAIGTKN